MGPEMRSNLFTCCLIPLIFSLPFVTSLLPLHKKIFCPTIFFFVTKRFYATLFLHKKSFCPTKAPHRNQLMVAFTKGFRG